jgi:hypothetical protein
MLIKRIVCALLVTGLIAISSNVAQAQSIGRRTWIRGNSANNPVSIVPDQERAAVAEMQTESLVSTADKKTAIVGSWLGISSGGSRLILTFNSDGTMHGSVQTEVSTIPEFGILTPAHGVWEYLGGRQFGYIGKSINYDINTGAFMGMLKARVLLTLDGAGDQMSGTDKVEIFGPDGELVFTASGNTTFTRIKFEPFN